VTLTTGLRFDHRATEFLRGGRAQTPVLFQPDYATEGKFEALEFAAGNRGLMESALEYANDRRPPRVLMTGPTTSFNPIRTTFDFVGEPSVIYYTTDGSRPTTTIGGSVKVWDATGPREPGQSFIVRKSTRFRWLAVDIKGNESTGQRRFTVLPSRNRD
jgi:hypothetical protein